MDAALATVVAILILAVAAVVIVWILTAPKRKDYYTWKDMIHATDKLTTNVYALEKRVAKWMDMR